MKDLKLEKLRPLDLRACRTVSDIVEAMRFCSLHARMLGEVAHTICGMIRSGNPPDLIYDGRQDTPLYNLLWRMFNKGWLRSFMSSRDVASLKKRRGGAAVMVGLLAAQAEETADAVYRHFDRTIFVNQYRLVKEGQVRDGHYPDVVLEDPNYVMPILYSVLLERLDGLAYTTRGLVESFDQYPGLAKQVADCAKLAHDIFTDPNYFVIMTATGAMTPAKMGLVFCELIENGWVQSISSTGAIQAHGLVETAGMTHYKYNPMHSDVLLAEHKMNRITDGIEPEENLDAVEEIFHEVLSEIDTSHSWSWIELNAKMGEYIAKRFPDARGILKAAAEHRVPVDIPAERDSELWNDLHLHNQRARIEGKPVVMMDPERTTIFLKKRSIDVVSAGRKLAIFSIGGGVPTNQERNVGPLVEIENVRLGIDVPVPMYSASVQVCPDPTDIGHLSGCTVSEGVSWRKYTHDVRSARAHVEATIALPFIIQYVRERVGLVG